MRYIIKHYGWVCRVKLTTLPRDLPRRARQLIEPRRTRRTLRLFLDAEAAFHHIYLTKTTGINDYLCYLVVHIEVQTVWVGCSRGVMINPTRAHPRMRIAAMVPLSRPMNHRELPLKTMFRFEVPTNRPAAVAPPRIPMPMPRNRGKRSTSRNARYRAIMEKTSFMKINPGTPAASNDAFRRKLFSY